VLSVDATRSRSLKTLIALPRSGTLNVDDDGRQSSEVHHPMFSNGSCEWQQWLAKLPPVTSPHGLAGTVLAAASISTLILLLTDLHRDDSSSGLFGFTI
jgi:hypothetical protein